MDVVSSDGCSIVSKVRDRGELETDQARSLRRAKWATRLAFFIAGFGLSCWAPLVPFAQERINADSALLGTVLLCLGFGAVVSMPTAGALAGKFGSKSVVIFGTLGLIIAMPLLCLASTPATLGATLLLFGASIGAIDVAANIHGTEVQKAAKIPLMSGFHGFYSIGGLFGVGSMTALLALNTNIVLAATLAAMLMAICIVIAIPGFLITRLAEKHPLFVVPKGSILIIGTLVLIIFLAEGAMLDWGAILLSEDKKVDISIAGTGYTLFALAMTASRLVGDRVVSYVGELRILITGLPLTAAAIAIAAFADQIAVVLSSMAFAGLAAGNLVPVLFTLVGRQKAMPASHAIAAASILGYLGVLLGPALVGYAAHVIGLKAAFVAIGGLLLLSILMVPAIASLTRVRSA